MPNSRSMKDSRTAPEEKSAYQAERDRGLSQFKQFQTPGPRSITEEREDNAAFEAMMERVPSDYTVRDSPMFQKNYDEVGQPIRTEKSENLKVEKSGGVTRYSNQPTTPNDVKHEKAKK